MVSLTAFIKKKTGFTLIEVIVVIGIATLLTTLLLINGNQGQKVLQTSQAAQELAADIRTAQQYALSARVVSDEECASVFNVPNYGVIINVDPADEGHYNIFADCNRNGTYQTATADHLLSTSTLQGVAITTTSPSPHSDDTLPITFEPPDPTVFIKRKGGSATTFTITLCHLNDITYCIDVQGNDKGNVEVVR